MTYLTLINKIMIKTNHLMKPTQIICHFNHSNLIQKIVKSCQKTNLKISR